MVIEYVKILFFFIYYYNILKKNYLKFIFIIHNFLISFLYLRFRAKLILILIFLKYLYCSLVIGSAHHIYLFFIIRFKIYLKFII